MNRQEFEQEFEKIRITAGGKNWHQHVFDCMPYLSKEALRYIAQNDGSTFFGEWMVRKAVDILIFEEVVLGIK